MELLTQNPTFSSRRVALVLSMVAALWDAFWLVKLLLVALERALSPLEVLLFLVISGTHAIGLAVFLLPFGRWLGLVLALCALSIVWAGCHFFYVVWPAAGLLLAASAFGWGKER